MRKENFKSDLRLTVTLTLGGIPIGVPAHDFALRFFTDETQRGYTCYRKGDQWVNCLEEDGNLVCCLDNHNLGTGTLMCEFYDFAPDADFADGNQLKVVPSMLDIELVEGQGDDAASVDASVAIDIVGALADVRAAVARLEELLSVLHCGDDGFFYIDRNGDIGFQYTIEGGLDAAKVSDHLIDLILLRLTTTKDGFYYTDAAGNIAFSYTPANGLDAAKVSTHLSDLVLLRLVTNEDGFYYCDAAGNVAFRYTPGIGLDAAKVSERLKTLVLSRLVTAEDGLHYTDSEGNVALRYDTSGFDVAKLSNHFKSLLPASGGSATTELKMLCVGNSYTHDEISYLPYVLKQMFPDMQVKIGIAFSGSATLSQWWTQRESAAIIGTPRWSGGVYVNSSGGFLYNPTRYTEWTSETGRWSDYEDGQRSLKAIIESDDWGIVTFQQESKAAGDYSTIETPLANLAGLARSLVPGVKVFWLFTHVYNDFDCYSSFSKTSDGRWEDVSDVVKTIAASGVVDAVIPNGTAVQNLRHTTANALGDASDNGHTSETYPNSGMTEDGSHLQEGIAPLCASMCAATTLTKAVPYVFLEFSLDWNVYGTNGDPVGMTPAYESMACKCAFEAVLSPYELTYEDESSSSSLTPEEIASAINTICV